MQDELWAGTGAAKKKKRREKKRDKHTHRQVVALAYKYNKFWLSISLVDWDFLHLSVCLVCV